MPSCADPSLSPIGIQATVSRAASSGLGKFRPSFQGDLYQNLPLGLKSVGPLGLSSEDATASMDIPGPGAVDTPVLPHNSACACSVATYTGST